MTTFYTSSIFFPLSDGGGIVNVRGDREIGTGAQLTLITRSNQAGIKDVVGALRGLPKSIRRRNDDYLLAQVPATTNFSGLSHGLAFALTEFLLANGPAPSRTATGQRVPIIPQGQLVIVATGEIDHDGRVHAVNEISAKIAAILSPATWPNGYVPEAELRVFVFPKANDSEDIKADLVRLREAGWEYKPVESIEELADLYEPKPPKAAISDLERETRLADTIEELAGHDEPKQRKAAISTFKRWTPVAGVVLGVGLVLKLVVFTTLGQDTSLARAPAADQAPVRTSVAVPDPLVYPRAEPFVSLPVGVPVRPPLYNTLSYSGQLTLEVVTLRDDGSLGPVLAEAHPFVPEDRIGLILTHAGSNRLALAMVKSGNDGAVLAEVVLNPGRPVPRRSFDVGAIVGSAGGPSIYVVDCVADCTTESASLRAWIEASDALGLRQRTGVGDGSLPLILNANLKLWSPR